MSFLFVAFYFSKNNVLNVERLCICVVSLLWQNQTKHITKLHASSECPLWCKNDFSHRSEASTREFIENSRDVTQRVPQTSTHARCGGERVSFRTKRHMSTHTRTHTILGRSHTHIHTLACTQTHTRTHARTHTHDFNSLSNCRTLKLKVGMSLIMFS